jgi:hypothetical protein
VHRKFSNIHPADDLPDRKFGQVYIMDAETATHERAKNRVVQENCQHAILNELHTILVRCENPFVDSYKMMYEVEHQLSQEHRKQEVMK